MAPFLTFSRANYNVPQAVIAALSVILQHSVTTHDVDWQSVQCSTKMAAIATCAFDSVMKTTASTMLIITFVIVTPARHVPTA